MTSTSDLGGSARVVLSWHGGFGQQLPDEQQLADYLGSGTDWDLTFYLAGTGGLKPASCAVQPSRRAHEASAIVGCRSPALALAAG